MSSDDLAILTQAIPEVLRRQLEEEIVFGRLEPLARLTEEEVAARYGVSRSPVREALRLLEGDGLVHRAARRGIWVAPLSLRDFDEIYACRIPLEGLAAAGAEEAVVVVREPARAVAALELAESLSLAARVLRFDDDDALAGALSASTAVVSTVPAPAGTLLTSAIDGPVRLVDAIYNPWPTPLADRVAETGGTAVGGLVMLLNQAYRQVELFTGLPAPREAMAAVLA